MPFEIPNPDDPRIQELVDLYRRAGIELADGFDDLVDEDDLNKKFAEYNALLLLLLLLSNRSEAWANKNLVAYLELADARAIRNLQAISPGTVFSPGVPPQVRERVLRDAIGHFQKARGILELHLGRVFRALGLEQEFAQLATGIRAGDPTLGRDELDRKIRRKLAKDFRKTPVQVIGKDGRTYTFPLDYYANLIATNAKLQAESLTEIARALEAGLDLVQISNNPSTIGDWCDIYRGRVFSISGTTPGFPALNQIPNQGAPFHPHCHHTMHAFNPAGFSADQLRELGNVEERFLIGPGNDFNTMVRGFWAAKKAGEV